MITTTTTFFANQLHERKNPFILVFIVNLIYAGLAGHIVAYFDSSTFDTPLDAQHIAIQFLTAVILAPIIETLLFQVLIIETLRSFKVGDIYSVLISSLLFALSHSYNTTYIFVAFIPGVIFALYYIGLKRSRDWFVSAFFVFAVHSLYNLFVFFTNL